MMGRYDALIPINVLTGFLGSGKTTLLKRLLKSPDLANTAVLVNEFGEIGLDHQLLQHITENTLLLENGCMCCSIRGDLQTALKDLLDHRDETQRPNFNRVIIESSGLADPVPIAYTLLTDPVIQHHYRLGNIVATVDSVNANYQLRHFPETEKQIATADRLILTKTDLTDTQSINSLSARLYKINTAAQILPANATECAPDQLFIDDIYHPKRKERYVANWVSSSRDNSVPLKTETHVDAAGIRSFALTFGEPLDWTAFGIWLSMLLNAHGENVLRVKGLLNVKGVRTPVLINGVQHIVHPPSHLEKWPDRDQQSRLIFIVRNIESERIRKSLNIFNNLCNSNANLTVSK